MNHLKQKIGVIAGTPVDTQMGVDFVRGKGHEACGVSTASCPQEQNLLQFLKPALLTQKVKDIIQDFQKNDILRVMIYCNSLSSAVDMRDVRESFGSSRIITPLDIYKKIALLYKKIFLWAANGQCLSAVEKIFYEKNPSIKIIGVSMLPVIKAIEALEPPEKIVKEFDLSQLVLSYKDFEPLVLGCTHLPYLKEKLQQETGFLIIDPAEEMLNNLLL